MRERDLTRSRNGAATDEPRWRDRVVRRAERTLAGEPASSDTDDALNPRDLDCLVEVGWWQQPGQPSREHRLPRAWRPDHQDVVSTRGCDLQRALSVVL